MIALAGADPFLSGRFALAVLCSSSILTRRWPSAVNARGLSLSVKGPAGVGGAGSASTSLPLLVSQTRTTLVVRLVHKLVAIRRPSGLKARAPLTLDALARLSAVVRVTFTWPVAA